MYVALLAHGDTGDEVDQFAEIWHACKIQADQSSAAYTLLRD
jgi:hypothetical protein